MTATDGGLFIDPTTITSWPSALVAIVLILAVIGVPSYFAWNNSKQAKNTAKEIKTSITENNGGGSVKDALDRIEKAQAQHLAALTGLTARVETLEGEQSPPTTSRLAAVFDAIRG